MARTRSSPQTPLTAKADRRNPDVRLFEEAVLRLRGDWPAAATGLCMEANSLFGFSFGGAEARDRMMAMHAVEAVRLVGALQGPRAVEDVRRLATGANRRAPRAASARPEPRRRLRVA